MTSNRGRKFPAEPLTVAECRALLRHCGRGATGTRNRAIIAVLWRCGLRSAELVALRPTDVDFERGTVRVLRGKGSKARTVPICPEALALVHRWALVREHVAPQRTTLFCTLKGRPLLTSYLRHLLPRLGRRAGLVKRVHPHGLRHTYARELADERHPLPVIQAALGHDHAHTTSGYLGRLAAPDVIAALQDRPRFEVVSATGARQGALPLHESRMPSSESPAGARGTRPPRVGQGAKSRVLALALQPKARARARRARSSS